MDRIETYKVIIAEDEDRIRSHIVKQITNADMGFMVAAEAQTGKEALEQINVICPDVLITDIHMPQMDGLALLEQVCFKYPYIKSVVISGYAEFEYAQKAMKCNTLDYLLKPIDTEELHRLLNKLKILMESERTTIKERLKLPSGQYSPEEVVRILIQYIKENYTEDINFSLIAERFNYSPGHLSRIFSQYAGESPIKYLIDLRINKAKHLLRSHPELSVKQIGELIGYMDQSYFSRIFKKAVGVSPLEYR